MKKSLLFVVLMLFALVPELKAQCGPRREYAVEMPIEVGCFNSFKNKDVTLHGYNLDLGLKLMRVAVIGSAEFNSVVVLFTNNHYGIEIPKDNILKP